MFRRSAVALLAAVLLAGPAGAQEVPVDLQPARTQAIIAGAIAGGLDLAFGTYDLVIAGLERRPARFAAVAEMVVMVNQVVAGLSLGIYGLSQGDDLLLPVGALMAAVGGPLLLHAYWAIGHAAPPAHAVLLVPTTISDGVRAAPGLVAVGRF